MGVAFRYLLALASGEPAEPAAFVTEVPGWKVGDTFLAGEELQRFRILAIDPSLIDSAAGWDALFVVEPVEA